MKTSEASPAGAMYLGPHCWHRAARSLEAQLGILAGGLGAKCPAKDVTKNTGATGYWVLVASD